MQAVKCLYWMQDLHRHGDEAACLDVIKYSTCISALAKQGYPENAEALLNQMRLDYLNGNQKARPDTKIFDVVVSAWSGGFGEKSDGARAESLLRQMWTLHETSEFSFIRPQAQTYRRIIVAMKRANRPDRAEALLEEMEQLKKAGKLDEGPDQQDYQTVINSWTNSHHDDRNIRASQLEVKMHQKFHKRCYPPST